MLAEDIFIPSILVRHYLLLMPRARVF